MKKKITHPVFFQDKNNKEHVIAETQTIEETYKAIHDFAKDLNYGDKYIRIWIEPYGGGDPGNCKMVFDVGSWSEFFNIYFDTEEQAKAFLFNSSKKVTPIDF